MPKPEQRVILYRAGNREGSSTKSKRINLDTAKYYGRKEECPRCGKMFKDASAKHYQDSPNKIHCLPPR